ncbi:MAG: hemin uptake protein HemP [Minwuia sp.]|uniref:hemin uptake protein HemP n=1 Tax=Minwuia sp. TaxID=2493630 RepID=UPI003A84CFA6
MSDFDARSSRRSIPVAGSALGEVIDSIDLFATGNEIQIRHRGETYRLRLTGAKKLILVK